MGKSVTIKKVLTTIYNNCVSADINLRNRSLVGLGKDVRIAFDPRYNGAYTHPTTDKDVYRIVLGGRMVQQISKAPDTVTTKAEIAPFFDDIISAIYGLNYHEMGHILFTDMADDRIVNYPKPQYRGFLHSLFNIMEDPIVEQAMILLFERKMKWATSPEVFFNIIIERIFNPQCAEYSDDGSIGSFMQYLLLTLRCGAKKIANKNTVFEKYKSDLLPMIKDIIFENDGTERLSLTIKLGEWIIENIKEFNFEDMATPKESVSGKMPKGSGKPSGTGIKGSGIGKPLDEDDETPETEGGKPSKEEEAGESEDESAEDEEPVLAERPVEVDKDIDGIFDDYDFDDGADFQDVYLKDVCQPEEESANAIVDKWTEEFRDTIEDVSTFLNLFHARIKEKVTEGFTRGKLNIRRAMRDEAVDGCDTKIFNQKVRRGKAPDIAISLLCDNSGSMCGAKAAICAKAAAIFGQACEWAHVPFECNAFTKTSDCRTGTSINLHIKTWDETFEQSKPYWVANHSDYYRMLHPTIDIPFFSGNSEEINLYHIWQGLKKVDHETKILFVLCDGCTTGSKTDLIRLIKSMEDDGIVVVGIGICDTEVANVYSQSKIFASQSELEAGLADYLVDTLSIYAK